MTYALHIPSSPVSPVEDQSFAGYDFCSAANAADFDKALPPAYTRDAHNAYQCTPKSWADCGVVHHDEQMMPIFVNQYAGTANVYDWCAPHYSTYTTVDEDVTHTSFHHNYPGNSGDQFSDYLRFQNAECIPAVAY